jgi:hypothetical protein
MALNLNNTKNYLTALWNLEDVDRPAFRLAGWDTVKYQLPNNIKLDARLHKKFCSQMSSALESLNYDDDGMPILNSYTHINIHASLFGCDVDWGHDGEPVSFPIVLSSDDIGKIKEVESNEETELALLYQKVLFDHAKPEWRVTHTDLQGPTDTASLIWDYTDMLVSAMTSPEKVAGLLKKITEKIIMFERKQLSANSALNLNHNPGIWFPDNFGISCSEDLLAVVGPDWYREFGLPYNNRLSEEFNGIFIHSCGCFTQNLPVLKEHHLLRGVNFNLPEVDIEPLLDALAGKTVLVPRLQLPNHEEDLIKYLNYLKKKNLDRVHHYFILDNGAGYGQTPYSLDEVMALLKNLGIKK